MLTAGALLISLSILSVLEASPITDGIHHEDPLSKGPPPPVFKPNSKLWEILNYFNACDPNPCDRRGLCKSELLATKYTCVCHDPYEGPRCQFVRNICENVTCGPGDCVINMNKHPFYDCICPFPSYGPDCMSVPNSMCERNPCQNGGSCTQANPFNCHCPDGYTGKLCQIAPTDCYEGNGETYRGVVSVTEEGKDCLDWHSNFILQQKEDPYSTYSDFDGLESNLCRNPDGDGKPWCFYKRQGKLEWDYCNVKRCSEATQTPPVSSEPDSSPFSTCGISSSARRIFGSNKAVPGAHPWQVSVQARPKGSDSEFVHTCGGILLSSCWVLTAAHCIKSAAEYQVVLGKVNLIKQHEMGQTIPVIQTIRHENYIEAEAPHSDIALLHLRVTDHPYCAKENRFVKTVCLPDRMFPAGQECVISGWGATNTNDYSPQLLNARMILISNDKCNSSEVYRNKIDSSMLCAGNLQGCIRTGKGDSGGPMVCEQNGTHFVTGVVSWGYDDDCAFSVFANVHQFTPWIETKINRTFCK